MKKIILPVLLALLIVGCEKEAKTSESAFTSNAKVDANATVIEKEGFLTTKWCADNGMFADCRMESIVCGEGECFQKWEFGDPEKTELVLYVNDDMQYYSLEPSKEFLPKIPHLLEEAINKDLVKINGKLDEKNNIIVMSDYKAPEKAKAGFFKGCL